MEKRFKTETLASVHRACGMLPESRLLERSAFTRPDRLPAAAQHTVS